MTMAPEELIESLIEPVAVKEKKARREYDLSVMEAEQPQLVRLVAWLITIPGMSWHAIEKRAGMAWETVAAIAARNYDVQEWRTKAADMVALVLQAAGPGLLKRAAAGKLNAFEFKQLVDAWSQLSAQATVRHEHTINVTVTSAEANLMRMIDGKATTVQSLLYENNPTGLVGNQKEADWMGSEPQKTPALPDSAEIQPPGDPVQEA